MRLLFKFNLIFLVVFVAGLLGAGMVSYDLLQKNAKEEVLNHARLTMKRRWRYATTPTIRSAHCSKRR